MKTAYDKYDAIVRAIPPHIKAEGDLEFAISTRIYDLMTRKGLSKAEFALRGITQPMGIAQYETEKLFNDVASALPTIEEIEDELTNDID